MLLRKPSNIVLNFFLFLVASAPLHDGVGKVGSSAFVQLTVKP